MQKLSFRLYRTIITNKKGKQIKQLAEVFSKTDEDARRHIVHIALQEGQRVNQIIPTDDSFVYPGESSKRRYRVN
jgi:hypothetical protein